MRGNEPIAAADLVLPARSTFRLLTDRLFGPFWFGKLLSTAGIWVHNVVAAIVAFQLTGSAFVVGAVSAAQFLPQLFLAPASGALADRGSPRRQIIVGRVVSGAGSFGLAIVLAARGMEGMPDAWPVVLSAGVVGLGFVIGGPALHALLPTLVRGGDELPRAVALNNLPPTIGRAAGPMLGTGLLVTAGPAAAFAFAAATNWLFAIVLAVLPLPRRHAVPSRDTTTIRRGLSYLRTDRHIRLVLTGVLAIGVGADPSITLMPAVSRGLGHGEDLVGLLVTCFGVGAAMVFPMLGPLGRRVGFASLGVTGLICLGAATAFTGLAGRPAVAALAMLVAGAGFSLAVTGFTTELYTRVPPAFRGRMMAFWSMAFLGSRPGAALVNGALADATSTTAALLTNGGFVLAVAAVIGAGIRHSSREALDLRSK